MIQATTSTRIRTFRTADELRELYSELRELVTRLRVVVGELPEPGHYRILCEQSWLRSLERAVDGTHNFPDHLTETLLDTVERAEFSAQVLEVREP